MFEFHVGKIGRDLQGRVHEPEGGREDDVVTGLGKLPDHPFGVRALGDVLDKRRFDLVAECRIDGLPALVVAVCPAEIIDRTDINEADLDRVLGDRRAAQQAGRRHGGQCNLECSFHTLFPSLFFGYHRSDFYAAGVNALPIQAGAFTRFLTLSADISTNTTMVAM